MRILSISLFCFFTMLLTSCARVYEAPTAEYTTAAHSVIAVVPPYVTIQGRPKDNPDQLRAAEEADTYAFQHEIYSWMLRRKAQGRFPGVDLMAPEVINAKLTQAGYDIYNRNLTPREVADLLGVDAVVTARFNTDKPMSEGVALALGLVLDVWNPTHRTSVNLSIHDPNDGLVWNYDWANSGSFTSPEVLVSQMMRNASRRMPYGAR
ncbi:MAG: hypothetical protein AAF597_18090 [Bacteroidota bacterium]